MRERRFGGLKANISHIGISLERRDAEQYTVVDRVLHLTVMSFTRCFSDLVLKNIEIVHLINNKKPTDY